MLLHKSVEHDSRVRREARALHRAGHDVTVVHLPPSSDALGDELDGYRLVAVTPPSWVRRLLPFHLYRVAFLLAFVRALRRLRPDVVHAHDAAMLAPGWLGARLTRARLVYDSHELATGVPYRERLWATFVRTLEQAIVPRCAAVITVSEGIAARLCTLYRLDEAPTVVRNIPDLDGASTGFDVRGALKLGDEPLILHLGAPAPRRGCEVLVRAVSKLPAAHVAFLGDPWPGYVDSLERLAGAEAISERVHFLPSVPVEDVVGSARVADVGVSLLSGDCENHRLALPNKVFEYVAAGVPVVTSDLPELRALVGAHDIGRTTDADDPEALAATLREVIEQPDRFEQTLERAATDLSWEQERTRLTDLYERWRPRRAARRALVLVRNPCTHDARVLREARLLRRLGYETAIVATASSSVPAGQGAVDGIPVRRLAPGFPLAGLRRMLRLVRRRGPAPDRVTPSRASASPRASARPRFARRLPRLLVTLDWYRRGIGVVRREQPTLVHCNDYNTMWIGVAAKLRGARVVYDSHELWPDRNLRPEWRRWLLACEWLFVHVADRVVTTSPGYADVLARRYRTTRPALVRNVPEWPPQMSAVPTSGEPMAVYFGAITRNRGLEDAISALVALPRLRLRIVGPEAWGHAAVLRELAHDLGVEQRVELAAPVAPDDARLMLADACVGLALIQPACLSYRLTLPNKLFEYVHAQLPIVATNLPVIDDFVRTHGVGLTVEPGDPAQLAAALARLLDDELNGRCRDAAARTASQISWTSEQHVLGDVYRSLS
jgi:glycosyltransferase involved in cell wall biosynthesis